MLQSDWDGAAVAAVLAFFRAVWDVRGVCRRGLGFSDYEELRELILTSVRCPWLTQSCLTKSKKERRADRVRDPQPAPAVTIYRSDGASRGQGGGGGRLAGWGAAVWNGTAAGLGIGPPMATSSSFPE